jgi:hypothetical protein
MAAAATVVIKALRMFLSEVQANDLGLLRF